MMQLPGVMRWGLAIAVVAGVAACGSEPPTIPEGVPGRIDQGVVELRVPEPERYYRQTVVQTWLGRYPVANDGRFDAAFPDIRDNRFAFLTTRDQPNDALFYGYYFPEEFDSERLAPFVDRGAGVRINARSTAMAMVMMNPLLFDSTVEQRAMLAEEAVAHPKFELLVHAIEDVKAIDPTIPIKAETTPDLFVLSSSILVATMKTVAARLPDPPEPAFTPQAVDIKTDMAYPENTADGGIRLVNPKMIWYVAGIRPPDNVDWKPTFENRSGFNLHFISGKERWLDISIFPPKIKTVPPVEVDLDGISLDANLMFVYKGFQFDYPFEDLWETPPARMAMLANSWAAWNMMIALGGDISNIFFSNVGGFLELMSDKVVSPNSFEQVWGVVQDRDRQAAVNSLFDVFVSILPAIEEQVKQQVENEVDTVANGSIIDQVGTLFESVWSLVSGNSVVDGILDITTQTIPFYFDLFTAQSTAVYPIFDGRIQELPDAPTISRLMPQQLVNGRNAFAFGFDFDQTPGNVWITGASGTPYKPKETHFWKDGEVAFRVPVTETGFDVGDGKKMLFVEIEKDDGTLTNQIAMPFAFVKQGGNGGGGGGGGCAVVAGVNDQADGAPWMLLIMLVLPALYARRRCRA